MFTIGLGQAEGIDTESVTQRVIAACKSQMQDQDPRAGIVFAGTDYDHQLMLDLIGDAFAGMAVTGCTTAGDFSTAFGFSDDAITLMTMSSEDIEFSAAVARTISQDFDVTVPQAVEAGRGRLQQDPALCLTFPMGYGIRYEPILDLLGSELGRGCPVFGGASGTQWSNFKEILQFYGREVLTDSMPILLMSGPVQFDFSIANSWRPIGKKAPISAAQDRRVAKIGGRSAVDFYQYYLGPHEEPAREFILAVYEPGREQYYLRTPKDYHSDGSISFSGSIPKDAQVQLTETVRGDLINDTRKTVAGMKTERDWEPAFALAFSCGFRKEVLGTGTGEELQILKDCFPPNLPIAGFYSFGEIAPLEPGGRSLAHAATLVTLLVGPKADAIDRDMGADAAAVAPTELEDLQERYAYIERKLQRSEAYRQRLESMKDFNGRMHRRIMEEIDQARQELLRKEAALRKSEEKYRRIVQTTGEGFLLMDESLTIIDVNDAFCRMVGYPRAEIIGRSNLDLASEEFRQFLISNREALLSEEYRKFEGACVTKDGRELPLLVHGNTLRDDQGKVIGNMAFMADLTDQKKALALAGEVQKSLLPQESPQVPGLDVAGRNISCDEVGGDYFDFFWRRERPKSPFSVAVGDITGHGVDAALLMTSARAFLRLHAAQNEPISDIICAANQHLAKDISESGRFMTLFFLTIDENLDRLEWIRAGHDPALIYDPAADRFEDLKGPGIALGIDDGFSYQPNRKAGLQDGQIIAIGTDGIWEACNNDGEMFGRERFKALLRQNARYSAGNILNTVFDHLNQFRAGRRSEDDITLVIIKIKKNKSN